LIAVIGRSEFPLPALLECVPFDDADWAIIHRSNKLGDKFHGMLQLKTCTQEGFKILKRAGWSFYEGGTTRYKS
jgi:hypothetical protein